jgi:glycosyltransferase involved in cell wall biosynthesis
MASQTPFLVTDVGNSSEIIDWSGGAGVLLPSGSLPFLPRYGTLASRIVEKLRIVLGRADDFIAVRANIRGSAILLEALYRNEARRKEMAQVGFRVWQERFTWEKIAGEYEALYQNLVENDA